MKLTSALTILTALLFGAFTSQPVGELVAVNAEEGIGCVLQRTD